MDNPWWTSGAIPADFRPLPKRDYFEPFAALAEMETPRRAVVLMGPRRVGKTVMLFQLVDRFLGSGFDRRSIVYASLDTPLYHRLSLEKLLWQFLEINGLKPDSRCLVLFDEIQYLKDWEVHLKSLFDTYREMTFVVSGSAAAALKLKSRESGAGRFSDFVLPPLAFAEFLRFRELDKALVDSETTLADGFPRIRNLRGLNEAFVDYVNFGGYPETTLSQAIRRDPMQFIRSDIVDKVLLRDLPSLYGISDTQELNRLFSHLAYQSGGELSLEGMAQESGVAKNTLKKYIEYLEAAYLIRRIRRVDQNATTFQRERAFKLYLTNTSLYAALFGPREPDEERFGHLVETAVFCQWLHDEAFLRDLHYARWKSGEVDFVRLESGTRRPTALAEIKWSDRDGQDEGVLAFARRNKVRKVTITSRERRETRELDDVAISVLPASLYCYLNSRTIMEQKRRLPQP